MNKADKLYAKVDSLMTPYLAGIRRARIKDTSFSIISNNCWAGSVYRYYGLPYQSPTAGLYFFASDYIKLISDLKRYMRIDPVQITCDESKWKDELIKRDQKEIPLGRLDDIEVVFLHYNSFEEARSKWNRRKQRINWNNIFFKFSEMNLCTEESINQFAGLKFRNKLLITAKNRPDLPFSVQSERRFVSSGQVTNDTVYFHHIVNLTKWLNSPPERYSMGL